MLVEKNLKETRKKKTNHHENIDLFDPIFF